ncbi:MAG: glycosyltransferase [Acidobacteria bacterium]|nr:glycosyltransferase [Acidobacteriota bacterium]
MKTFRRAMWRMGEWLEHLILPGFLPAEYVYAEYVASLGGGARRWLEAGCGRSVLPGWMRGVGALGCDGARMVVGLDASEESLRENRQVTARVAGSVEALPFRAGWFDLVTARFVMEHVEDPNRALAEVERVLAPGGVFLAHTPNRRNYMVRLAYRVPQRWKNWIIARLEGRASEDVFPVCYRFNTRRQVESAAAAHGLEVEEMRFHDGAVETLALGPLAIFELLLMRMTCWMGLEEWRSTMVVQLRKPQLGEEGERSPAEQLNQPRISVVIPALNEGAVIGACLESLAAQSMPREQFEVIVVDNGSTDDTEDVARSYQGRLTLSVLRKVGAAVGAVRNRGAAVARGKHLAFLDADCVAEREWVRKACQALDREPNSVLGAFYRVPEASSWAARVWYGDQHWLRNGTVSYIPGSDLLIRRSAFQALGGFDESISTSEDCEFCHRAGQAGMRIVAEPGLSVVHLGCPRTLRDFFWKQLWQGGDVPTVWKRDVRRGPGLRTVMFSGWIVLAMMLALAGLPAWVISSDARVFLAGATAVLVPCVVLAARASFRRRKPRLLPPLVPLYFLYGLARGLTLLGIRCPRGSTRLDAGAAARAARPGG